MFSSLLYHIHPVRAVFLPVFRHINLNLKAFCPFINLFNHSSISGRDFTAAGCLSCQKGRGRSLYKAVSPLSRSEEHTSELQSLMRISYAVSCLNKKKT